MRAWAKRQTDISIRLLSSSQHFLKIDLVSKPSLNRVATKGDPPLHHSRWNLSRLHSKLAYYLGCLPYSKEESEIGCVIRVFHPMQPTKWLFLWKRRRGVVARSTCQPALPTFKCLLSIGRTTSCLLAPLSLSLSHVNRMKICYFPQSSHSPERDCIQMKRSGGFGDGHKNCH